MGEENSFLTDNNAEQILELLSEKDMYGYEMIKTFRNRTQNIFEQKAGMLYPILHRMESKGIISAYEQEHCGKKRKYYSITGDI